VGISSTAFDCGHHFQLISLLSFKDCVWASLEYVLVGKLKKEEQRKRLTTNIKALF
jgi:hypothetical protein